MDVLLQALHVEVVSLQPHVDYISQFVNDLVADASAIEDTTPVTSDLEAVLERHAHLTLAVDDWLAQLGVAAERVDGFKVGGEPRRITMFLINVDFQITSTSEHRKVVL